MMGGGVLVFAFVCRSVDTLGLLAPGEYVCFPGIVRNLLVIAINFPIGRVRVLGHVSEYLARRWPT